MIFALFIGRKSTFLLGKLRRNIRAISQNTEGVLLSNNNLKSFETDKQIRIFKEIEP
jgi:hypothetical protein